MLRLCKTTCIVMSACCHAVGRGSGISISGGGYIYRGTGPTFLLRYVHFSSFQQELREQANKLKAEGNEYFKSGGKPIINSHWKLHHYDIIIRIRSSCGAVLGSSQALSSIV